MRKSLSLLIGGLLLTTGALAQSTVPVTTQAQAVLSGNASSTITVTNTFQQVWPQASASASRKGCLIMNTSTDRQWVFFGSSPTKAAAIPLEAATATNGAGGWVSCSTGAGAALQDQVWITGTAGDTYVAAQQ